MAKINIHPPDAGISKLLTSQISRRLTLFLKEAPEINSAELRLRHDTTEESDNKVCELYLSTATKNIFTVQKGKSYEASTAKAIAKLQKQMEKGSEPAAGPQAPQ